MIYERIKSEYDMLCNRISSIESELETLPPGKLICCYQQNSVKWYSKHDQKKCYIPKANRFLAEQLARKKYLSLLIEDLKKEQKALAFYLKHHSPLEKSKQLLTTPSEYQRLLEPYFKPLSEELNDWMHTPYNKNPNHPENLSFNGISDNLLRSKSEVLIDMMLYTHKIPFRYECELVLGDTLIFPDFTIRHPKTGDFYFWEHFGLMDIPAYIDNASSKIKLYASHGITPGIRLITTYETKEHPISPDVIEMYIKHHFL